ncbi:MAG: hypothetical protein ACYCW6_32030, partial [Candidatus Xenobia bacterium]
MQHFLVLDTLLWLPLSLFAWDRFAAGGSGSWVALDGVAAGFQILGGYPQYAVYNWLLMGAFMAHDLWRSMERRRLLTGAIGVFAVGVLIGLPVSLPGADLLRVSQRAFLPASFFAEYTSAPWAVPLALCREGHFVPAVRALQTGGVNSYPLLPELSIVSLLFALLTLRRERAGWWILIGILLVGMTGTLRVIFHGVPIVDRMRAASRMITPASMLLSMLAAEGMARWLKPGRQAVALLCLAWVLGSGYWLNRPLTSFGPPSLLTVPEWVDHAPDRIAVQPSGSPYDIDAPMIVGKQCLSCVKGLCVGSYFEAMFASQVGPLSAHPDLVELAGSKAYFPINHPDLPLMKAFGLRSVVDDKGVRIAAAFPRFWVATHWLVAADAPARWKAAASKDWDPAHTAIVERPLGTFQGSSAVSVLRDEADTQQLVTDGGGGLLISSAQLMPGWEVTVDGTPAAPIEADLALRGVLIGPGHHQVTWRYRPRWVRFAMGGVAVGLLLALLLARC